MNSHDYAMKEQITDKPQMDRSLESSGSGESSDQAAFAHKENNTNPVSNLQPIDTYQTYEEHGVLIDDKRPDGTDPGKADYEHHKHLWWYRVRHTLREPFAEFCGTMIMIVFGDGSVAQVLLSANPNLPAGSQNKGQYQSITWGWGIGVMIGIYVAGCAGGKHVLGSIRSGFVNRT